LCYRPPVELELTTTTTTTIGRLLISDMATTKMTTGTMIAVNEEIVESEETETTMTIDGVNTAREPVASIAVTVIMKLVNTATEILLTGSAAAGRVPTAIAGNGAVLVGLKGAVSVRRLADEVAAKHGAAPAGVIEADAPVAGQGLVLQIANLPAGPVLGRAMALAAAVRMEMPNVEVLMDAVPMGPVPADVDPTDVAPTVRVQCQGEVPIGAVPTIMVQ
jgi:hypothetical protein